MTFVVPIWLIRLLILSIIAFLSFGAGVEVESNEVDSELKSEACIFIAISLLIYSIFWMP